jgi:hypothetical protein
VNCCSSSASGWRLGPLENIWIGFALAEALPTRAGQRLFGIMRTPLGPGIPEPPQAKVPASVHRHKLPTGYRVRSTAVLGGLHHEYRLEKEAA